MHHVENWHEMMAESWMDSFCTIIVNVDFVMKGMNMHLSLVHNWGWCWPFLSKIYCRLSNYPNPDASQSMAPIPLLLLSYPWEIPSVLKLKVGIKDMKDDASLLYPHPSASSNGEKEVQSWGSVNVFNSTLLMWVNSNVNMSAPDDP